MADLNKLYDTDYGGRHHLVRFIPAKNLEVEVQTTPKSVVSSATTGEEARQFYEELISQPTTSNATPTRSRSEKVGSDKRTAKKSKVENSKHCEEANDPKLRNRLLKSAQNNNLKDVKICVEMGVDINCKDEYDWTSLMCAAHSGANDVVRYLLQQNCDKELEDTTGRTAAGIALIANKISTYEIIQNGPERKVKVNVKPEPEDVFFCEICDKNVTGKRLTHEASVSHQLNESNSRERKTMYQLPEHNRGYQMMLRSGWSDDRGLGSEGQGQKYPVKTVLRKDRACLGHIRKEKGRITHSTEEIEAKPGRKVVVKPPKPKGKAWERAMRSYMNL